MERDGRKSKRKLNVRKLILGALRSGVLDPFASGGSSRARIMRQQLKFLENLLGEDGVSRQQKYYVSCVIKKLIEENLVKSSAGGLLSLSKKGEEALDRYVASEDVIKKPVRWDGKFRLIIFDVPEEKRLIRKYLRKQLVEWGFIHLQHSVWVIPYECQDVISLLKIRFGLTEDVLYITAETIENDRWLRQEFGLM